MSYIEKINAFLKQQETTRNEIAFLKHNTLKEQEIVGGDFKTLMEEADTGNWLFFLHTSYGEIGISFWMRGEKGKRSGRFIIKDDCVEMYTTGMYPDTWREPEAILNNLLYNSGEK